MGRREAGCGVARGADYMLSWPPKPQPRPTALVFLQTLRYEQGAEGEGGAGFSGSGNSCALLLTGDFTYEVFTVERGSTHGGSVSIAALDLVPWPGEP